MPSDSVAVASATGGHRKGVTVPLIALVTLLLLLAVVVAVLNARGTSRAPDGGDDGDGGGDDGGSMPRVPPHHPPGPPDTGEPDWWPEFERAFADYARRSHAEALRVGALELEA
jgi:hypothetical protein